MTREKSTKKRRLSPRTTEKIAFWTLGGVNAIILFTLLAIMFFIFRRGFMVLSWSFITESPKFMMTRGGIFPVILGTVLLVIFSISFSLPVGVLSAIYLTEYSTHTRIVKLIHNAIMNLNGVPSIVFGLFGFAFFVRFLNLGACLLSASLTLATMILPTIILTSIEALKAVPQSFREAALALGATKWESIRDVVLPNAIPGILTGAILGMGRAAGETAPILFTGAVYYRLSLPRTPFDTVMALPYHLYVLAAEHPFVVLVRPIQYGTALVLLITVFILDLSAILLRYRFREMRRKAGW
jgi:phosphate transport system permease protein